MDADQMVGRDEILRRLDEEYRRFHAAIAPLTPQQLQRSGVVGSWSIKDLIAHFIVHEQFALDELQHALRGEIYPLSGADSDAMNASAVAERQHQSIDEILAAWDRSYRAVVETVQRLSDDDFNSQGSVVQTLDDTIEGALANNTYEHCAEHLPAVEEWILRTSNFKSE